MEYTVVYSSRKSIAICVKSDGSVIVKCPKYIDRKMADNFVNEKRAWIENTKNKILNSQKDKIIISKQKENELREKALKVIENKVEYYSRIMNVEPKKVIIGNAKSYWGYCDIKNNINFSWRLMLASDNAIDYVVVHELTHIKHHNHSKEFWKDVCQIIPDYKKLKKELNELSKKF